MKRVYIVVRKIAANSGLDIREIARLLRSSRDDQMPEEGESTMHPLSEFTFCKHGAVEYCSLSPPQKYLTNTIFTGIILR